MDDSIIRKWFAVFKNNSELTEIRVIEPGMRKHVYSGYFTDVEKILEALRPLDHCQIYFTLNAINPACYNRAQHDYLLAGGLSTSGEDIIGREWCLIDVDVKRPSGTNATDEEVRKAVEVANKICIFLRDNGFTTPVTCMSGNGAHILIRQNMANTQANTETMKKFLQVLDMLFSSDGAHVDCSTFDPNRICKLYGCVSRKGINSFDRPQRIAYISSVPDLIVPTPNEYFEKVAAMMPEQEKPSRFNNWSTERFDLETFISQHGINVVKRQRFGAGEKLILDECPFCSSHKAPDSALFHLDNGAIGFKCLHNSCSQYTWKDVRLKFDPSAYDHRDYKEFERKQAYYGKTAQIQSLPVEIVAESKEKGKKWLKMGDIIYRDPSQLIAVPSGIEALDKKILGFTMGDVTVISGLSGAGKTSIIDFFILNAVQRDYKCAVWSGELQDFRFQAWIDQMAAGPNFVRQKEGYDNLFYAPKEICTKIHQWLGNRLFLYNNDYGNRFSQIFADIKECVEQNGVQLVVVDNLMSLQLDSYLGEKNERQTGFINDLKDFAKKKNIHIILVCHPRKEMANTLLRKESIAGTADLTNLADNVLIIHRVGRDFSKRAKDFLGKYELERLEGFDSAIEVCKNRSLGVMDFWIGLYYDKMSRRYKNTMSEHLVYGWQEDLDIDGGWGNSSFDNGDMPDYS